MEIEALASSTPECPTCEEEAGIELRGTPQLLPLLLLQGGMTRGAPKGYCRARKEVVSRYSCLAYSIIIPAPAAFPKGSAQ